MGKCITKALKDFKLTLTARIMKYLFYCELLVPGELKCIEGELLHLQNVFTFIYFAYKMCFLSRFMVFLGLLFGPGAAAIWLGLTNLFILISQRIPLQGSLTSSSLFAAVWGGWGVRP